jgi:hypothetical protein
VTLSLAGIDTLFLMFPFRPSMVRMAEFFFEEVDKTNIQHIVLLSSMGANSVTITMVTWHRMIEKLLMQSGIDYTILRPNSFMQNFSSLWTPMVQNGVISLPMKNVGIRYVDAQLPVHSFTLITTIFASNREWTRSFKFHLLFSNINGSYEPPERFHIAAISCVISTYCTSKVDSLRFNGDIFVTCANGTGLS